MKKLKQNTTLCFVYAFISLMSAVVISPIKAQDAQTDLMSRINGLRASLGLEAYRINGALNAAASNHADWMASIGEVSHVQYDGSRPRDRAQAAGYSSNWVSENIYMGSDGSPNTAWSFWLNSPVHYAGLTNPNYQEVGIAAASGSGGTAFVLVFGNPGGASAAPRVSVAGGDGDQAASGPPPWVVGVDAYGNIMHEVRTDDTWGDILLDYGYDWDDLERVLALNGMNMIAEDIRSIQPGDVVLVPPYHGTYTPTAPAPDNNPGPTSTPEDTSSEDIVANNEPTIQPDELDIQDANSSNEVATSDIDSDTGMGIIDTQAPLEETTPLATTDEALAEASSDSNSTNNEQITSEPDNIQSLESIPTLTATPSSTPIEVVSISTQNINSAPGLMVRTLPARTLVPTPNTIIEEAPETSSNQPITDTPPAWLIVVLIIQAGILGFAGLQLIKQRR